MIRLFLSLSILCLIYASSWSQTTVIYNNDFENGSNPLTTSFGGGPNQWIRYSCAGNGASSLTGSNSLYITPGGVINGCGPGGKEQHAYENNISGISFALAETVIDATCAGNLVANFDYKTEGVALEDYTELVYSIDNGVSWTPITVLSISSNWTATSIPLPALLNFSVFNLGVRFTYNAATVVGIPPAIDNISVTGIDNVDPVITTCIPNTTLYLDNSCSVFAGDYTNQVIASDNCSSVSELTITQSPLPTVFEFTTPGQTQLFTITVTDEASNSSQCTFTITAFDTTKPVVTCPTLSGFSYNAACQAAIPDISSGISWSDNCVSNPALMTFSQLPAAGTIVTTSMNILYTVEDPYGNIGTCASIFTVVDDTPPVLICPSDANANLNAACFAVLDDFIPAVVSTENCFFLNPVTLTQLPVQGSLINVPTLITITGEDESGNIGTCTFTVTPIDAIAPTITCPSNTSVAANAACAHVIGDLSGTIAYNDNCTSVGSITFNQSPASGSILPTGMTPIVINIEDASGNTATCTYQLTVVDQAGPSITCPANVNITMDATCSGTIADYTSGVSVSDNCSSIGNITLSQSPASGTTISANTQIIITATDELGNASNCNFFAISIDAIDPTITCPSSLSMPINSSCQYPVPDLLSQVNISDNCTSLGNLTFTQNPTATTTGSSLTAVLLTVQDEQGNQSTCVTLLIPDDIEAPIVTCPSPATVNNGSNCDYILPNYGTTTLVLDNCSNFTITQTPAPGSTVQAGPTLIDIEVADVAGNIVTCSFTLDVNETVNPTITCPANIATCDPTVTYSTPVFGDNCSATAAQTDLTGLTSGDDFPVGITTLQYTAIDLSGNTQTCSFTVEIYDFPAIATIVEDSIGLCESTSAVLTAQAHTTGTGEWTLLSGQGNFNNQFTNSTGVNNLSYGTNVFVYTISTLNCGTTSDTIVVIASQQPLPASTQDTIFACGDNQVSLLSNTPIYGVGTWTTNDPSALIGSVNSSNTSATSLSEGWYNYIWTITNGSCPSESDTLKVYVSVSANIIQNDTTLCIENGTMSLTGAVPSAEESVFWKFIQGGGEIESPLTNQTNVSNLNLGVNTIVYTITHPTCTATTDTIDIISTLCEGFDPVFPTVITPNLDGKNDLFVINYLEKVYPDCQVVIFNRWGSIVYESIGYVEPWDGTFNGEDLPMGTYFYKIELNDPESTVYSGPISIIR